MRFLLSGVDKLLHTSILTAFTDVFSFICLSFLLPQNDTLAVSL